MDLKFPTGNPATERASIRGLCWLGRGPTPAAHVPFPPLECLHEYEAREEEHHAIYKSPNPYHLFLPNRLVSPSQGGYPPQLRPLPAMAGGLFVYRKHSAVLISPDVIM